MFDIIVGVLPSEESLSDLLRLKVLLQLLLVFDIPKNYGNGRLRGNLKLLDHFLRGIFKGEKLVFLVILRQLAQNSIG